MRHSSPSITDRRWNSVHNFLKLAEEPPGSLRGRRTLPCSNQDNTTLMSGSSRCADRNSAPPPLSEYTGTGSVCAPSAGGEWSDTSTEATAQSPAEGASGSTKSGDTGRRDRASAFLWRAPSLWTMTQSNGSNSSTHLHLRPVGSLSMAMRLRPSRGRWSVMMQNVDSPT